MTAQSGTPCPLYFLVGPGGQNKPESIANSQGLILPALLLGYLLRPCFEMNTLAWLSFPRETLVSPPPCCPQPGSFFLAYMSCHSEPTSKGPLMVVFCQNLPTTSPRAHSTTSSLPAFLVKHRKLGKLKPICIFCTIFLFEVNFFLLIITGSRW